ncbi:MAG TPA: protein kinase [Solirubrobacteraceae bacterium]|jgi:serine/threonine-protein kinase|nr:protein kinase [Solirubrobacteraceae bacterium]
MSTPVGTLLSGRYRLDAHIGAGGMSMVYRAFDTVLERQVAIKLMNREVASDSEQLERFRREARAVAQLSHPHIVTVIDAGDDGGPSHSTPFIVFEYVEGETLKERIRRLGRLPIPEAVAYAIEVGRALGCAHERAIVHRDVKPQNVLVDAEGSAKITDFGIARTLTEEGLTADGRVLGTTDYVSPEQALGHPVTGQSDLYSLGIVLYEMLTGTVPFRGENQVAVAMMHVREEVPDVQSMRPEVSSALAAIVDRATAKSLDRRYPDTASMLGDLEEALAIETARSGQATGEVTTVLRTLPGSARRRLPLRLRHPAWPVAGAVLLGLTAVVVLVLAAGHTHRGTGAPVNIVVPPRQQPIPLASDSAHDYNPFALSPPYSQHPEQRAAIVDRDPSSSWSTESYSAGTLGKPGVGIYLDAQPRVVARSIELQTPTPGFAAEIWGANQIGSDHGDPRGGLSALGWTKLGATPRVAHDQPIPLDTATQSYRYYLVWITKLPPSSQKASIDEVTLFK